MVSVIEDRYQDSKWFGCLDLIFAEVTGYDWIKVTFDHF